MVAILGDLAHFGDRTSVRYVVDAVANDGRPAILLSGNHDVLTPGVRLEDEVRARGATHVVSPLASVPDAPAVKAFAAAGAGLAVHEVTALTDRGPQPFDVHGSRLADADQSASIDVWLTHFPLLSFEDRCREAQLLYSAHLDQLAPPPEELPASTGPVVVLSGHLHVRATTTAANVLQLGVRGSRRSAVRSGRRRARHRAGVGCVSVRVGRAVRRRAPAGARPGGGALCVRSQC